MTIGITIKRSLKLKTLSSGNFKPYVDAFPKKTKAKNRINLRIPEIAQEN